VVWGECYRLPLSPIETGLAPLETRRADDALSYLRHSRAVTDAAVLAPEPVSYSALAQVHTDRYLDALQEADTLARVFAIEPSDVVVDELLKSVRAAVGGTLAATHATLRRRVPVLNLFGGFHHAAPDRGAGFCALNDVAVAVTSVRSDGFAGTVAILDLDFHPPDGTAECFCNDEDVWLGSISGADWGALRRVDETVLPPGTDDASYLLTLDALLRRLPKADLYYVLAGGDVLAGDRLGTFALSLQGIQERDRRVAARLGAAPQVWLPAGGYGPHAWKVVAGTGLVLAFGDVAPIASDYDPLGSRMRRVARSMSTEELGDSLVVTDEDVAPLLGKRRAGPKRFLDYYTAQGVEYALERYRLLPVIRRLGYDNLRVELDRTGLYDRVRLRGRDTASGEPVVLLELECERRRLGAGTFLFVNWLSLRHPRAKFSAARPKLPGQDVPGLGLAREITHILALIARRLRLDGVAFRPSWFHMAYTARYNARFLDSGRQGRFEGLVRDLDETPLLEATRLVADGRVLLNGAPYTWEAEEMVTWLDGSQADDDREAIAQERARCHFTIAPRSGTVPTSS
jgi:acetoin utilization deacetylase AcuC-like enzyme